MEALALLFSLNINARKIGLWTADKIRALNGKLVGEPYMMQIIEEIRLIAHQINCNKFSFIRRSANDIAHILAQNVDYEQIWLEDSPPPYSVSFLNDVRHLPTIST